MHRPAALVLSARTVTLPTAKKINLGLGKAARLAAGMPVDLGGITGTMKQDQRMLGSNAPRREK